MPKGFTSSGVVLSHPYLVHSRSYYRRELRGDEGRERSVEEGETFKKEREREREGRDRILKRFALSPSLPSKDSG